MAKSAMQSLKEKEKVLQDEVEKFRTIQKGIYTYLKLVVKRLCSFHQVNTCLFTDIQKSLLARKQLDAQLNENTTVKTVGSCKQLRFNWQLGDSSSIPFGHVN